MVIDYDFYLGVTVVTQSQWIRVMDTRPWAGRPYVLEGEDGPAVYISWREAKAFADELGRLTRRSFRLPSEAEWEHACWSGSQRPDYLRDNQITVDDHANSARGFRLVWTCPPA